MALHDNLAGARRWLHRWGRVTALADPRKIIFVDPEHVTKKVLSAYDIGSAQGSIVDGDWDLRTYDFAERAKYRAIAEHFEKGVKWEDTELFLQEYAARFRSGERVRGTSTLEELKRRYERTVDRLYVSMREQGFVLTFDRWGSCTTPLPHVHVGRGGELLYGTKGNHRLAIAKLLHLSVIPCLVRSRHRQWQELREAIQMGCDAGTHSSHPDLQDLLGRSRQTRSWCELTDPV